jgi:hypothetical protein
VEPAQLVVLVAQPLVEVLRELLFWEQFREVIIPEILLSMREMVVGFTAAACVAAWRGWYLAVGVCSVAAMATAGMLDG